MLLLFTPLVLAQDLTQNRGFVAFSSIALSSTIDVQRIRIKYFNGINELSGVWPKAGMLFLSIWQGPPDEIKPKSLVKKIIPIIPILLSDLSLHASPCCPKGRSARPGLPRVT